MVGGHLAVLSAFARSFTIAPAGRALINPAAATVLMAETSRVIELGVRMSAPYLALNFLVTLAFSVLGRAVPRIGVFVLSASIRSLLGFTLFGGAGALIGRYLVVEYADVPFRILQVIASH
jgi:flagellar biosynthetic protein FliR